MILRPLHTVQSLLGHWTGYSRLMDEATQAVSEAARTRAFNADDHFAAPLRYDHLGSKRAWR